MFEYFLNKILNNDVRFRPPPLRFSGTKTEKFSLHFFNRAPLKIFSIRKQFLRALLPCWRKDEPLPTPSPASRDNRRAKIPPLQTSVRKLNKMLLCGMVEAKGK